MCLFPVPGFERSRDCDQAFVSACHMLPDTHLGWWSGVRCNQEIKPRFAVLPAFWNSAFPVLTSVLTVSLWPCSESCVSDKQRSHGVMGKALKRTMADWLSIGKRGLFYVLMIHYFTLKWPKRSVKVLAVIKTGLYKFLNAIIFTNNNFFSGKDFTKVKIDATAWQKHCSGSVRGTLKEPQYCTINIRWF